MRLLLTTDTIGGVWTFAEELARGLLLSGHEVALLSFGGFPSPAQASATHVLDRTFGSRFRYTASTAPLEWMQENKRTRIEGRRAVLKLIDDFRPDLLHSNQLCFGALQPIIPVLVTAHSDVLGWAECTLGSVAELERTASPAWLNTYQTLVLEGLIQASAVVVPTVWMGDKIAGLYSLRAAPAVIPNGVSLEQPAAIIRKLQAVTAGRLWDEAKGLAILNKIDAPLPVYVAGEQPSMRFSDKTEWLGSLPRQDLLNLFGESAIYLATSVYEPFGLAPLEAALCGCAVVARDLPTFREVWGDAALYFQSAESLQHLLSSLVADPHRLKAARHRAAKRAASYTAKIMTERYLAVYRDVLNRKTTATQIHSQEQALKYG